MMATLSSATGPLAFCTVPSPAPFKSLAQILLQALPLTHQGLHTPVQKMSLELQRLGFTCFCTDHPHDLNRLLKTMSGSLLACKREAVRMHPS